MNQAHFKYWSKRLSRSLSLPQNNLYDNLAVSARRYPGKAAIDFYGNIITYGELDRRVCALAGYLRREGALSDGDRVLLDMQNSPAFIVAYYAILRAGGVVVPVNPMNRTDELSWCVEDSGARLALVAQEVADQVQPLVAAGLLRRVVVACYGDDLPPSSPFPIPEMVAAPARAWDGEAFVPLVRALAAVPCDAALAPGGEATAMLVYTSGTTGKPKGCILSHRALNAAIAGLSNWNRWTADAVALATAPYFHITGMISSLTLPIHAGATIVLLPRWDRQVAVRLIESRRVSHWTNVPTMVVDLLALPGISDCDLSSICCIGGGGTAMPEAVAARLKEITGLEYQEGWGLTEVCGAIHLNPVGHARRQCLGIPCFDVDTRVIDTDSGAQLGPNQQGELLTRCPSLFSGYWNNPQATAAAYLELEGKPYFRTGDIGYFDDDGFFYLSDRLKRMINAAGYKVWPAEVENILYRHPEILEACVIGVADPRRGETVRAYVVRKEGQAGKLSEEALIEWSRAHMAAYKIPRSVRFVEALPKSGTGKVLWRMLQEQEKGA